MQANKIIVTGTRFNILGGETRAFLESKGYELITNPTSNPFYPREELKAVLPQVVGAIVALDQWDEELFSVAPNLKVIAKFGVGVDNIDLVKAKEYGIKVLNVKGGNANAVAEYSVALMLDVLRRISQTDAGVKGGLWPRFTGGELTGRTVGLLGFGDIARKVARRLSGFDVKLIAYDLYPDEVAARELGVEMVSQEDVLRLSDILSIHIPSLPSTYHFINAETIAMMKRGSYMINCARGAIVDSEALCDAVESGHLAGAGVDVFEKEPADKDDRLLHTANIITTAHLAAETVEAYKNIAYQTSHGIVDVLEGREPKNWLNR